MSGTAPGGRFAIFYLGVLIVLSLSVPVLAQDSHSPAPPSDLRVVDHPLDGGNALDVTFSLSPDDTPEADPKTVVRYAILRSSEAGGLYSEVATFVPEPRDYERGTAEVTVGGHKSGRPYYYRVKAIGPGGVESPFIETAEPAVAEQQWFDGGRRWLAVIMAVICGAVVLFILLARRGISLKVRKIAGLEAVDEAVGRATEMGRSILFIPGIQDMNDIQTLAGITVLSHVAQVAAEYDAKVEVPTSRSLVMTTARETVQSAFLAAGRPDAFNEENVYYVTDEQFGYVAYLSGLMVREKPAACFYMGSFYAESLILAETGNAVGAIQVAGTAQPAQLPFFVAACDYTLIGEEFFAASAYLSGDPDQIGSLKGQDLGKLLVAALLVVGCGLVTAAAVSGNQTLSFAAEYLRDVVLQ